MFHQLLELIRDTIHAQFPNNFQLMYLLWKMIIILKELRIAQLCYENERTLVCLT